MRIMKPLRSIRVRVTAGAVLIVALVLGLAGFATASILSTTLHDSVANTLAHDLNSLGKAAGDDIEILESYDQGLLARISGEESAVSDPDAASLPQLQEPTRILVQGRPYLADSIQTEDGVLTIARPLEQVEEAVNTTTTLLQIGIPLVLVLIFIVVWIVTGRALKPVENLRRQVDAIHADDLSARVDAGDDELGALAGTMNQMLARLEQAQTTQRRFVSDASHELRSPLATMRQHAELAQRYPQATSLETLSDTVQAEGERMQQLVEGLLLLAKLDEGQRYSDDAIDLDDLLFAEASRLRRATTLAIDSSQVQPARFHGNAQLLGRVIRNLSENAARHATSRIRLSLFKNEAGWLLLEIEDDGAGVPVAQREVIFERFARLDESRNRDLGGSGLGLAIVQQIAMSYTGKVWVEDSELGGAKFVLQLPADQS